MKQDILVSAKLFFKLLLVSVFCIFAVLGISVLCNNFFVDKIGYTAYGVKNEGGNTVKLYEYKYSDGEDTLKKEYEDKGYTVTTMANNKLTKTGYAIFSVAVSAINIAVIFGFAYPKIKQIGLSDQNLYSCGRKKKDILKGLKIGLMANVPNFIFLLLIFVLKNSAIKDFNMTFYKWSVCYLYAPLDIVLGTGKVTAANVSGAQFFVLLLIQLIIPLICTLAYISGFKNFSLSEKLVYGNKKGDKK